MTDIIFSDRVRGRSYKEDVMRKSYRIGKVSIRQAGAGVWVLDVRETYSVSGKRERRSFPSRKAAEAEAQLVNDEILSRRFRGTGILRRSCTFEHLYEQWRTREELRVSTHKKRSSSLETDLHRAKPLLAFFSGMYLDDISEAQVEKYQANRLNAWGRKPNTVNGEVRTLRKMLRWGKKSRLVSDTPEFEMIPVKASMVEPLSEAEMAALVQCCPPRLRLLVAFMVETGCRSGEARNLTWDCVAPAEGAVEFRFREDWQPKSGHSERRVYLSAELMTAILKVPRLGRYVFPGRVPGQPIGSFRKALAAASTKAGIARGCKPFVVKPHMLRKSRATQHALNPDVTMALLQKQLGHSAGSSVTMKHYVSVPDAAMRALAKPVAGLDWDSLVVQKGKKGQRKKSVLGILRGAGAEGAVK